LGWLGAVDRFCAELRGKAGAAKDEALSWRVFQVNQMSPARRISSRAASAAKKAMIVDSALALFAELGFAGVSLRLIATHAGVPLSTLVHHFGNKKVLYDQAVTRAFERTTFAFDSILDESAAIETQLRHLMHRLMGFQLAEPLEMRIIDQALLDRSGPTTIDATDLLTVNHRKMKALFCRVAEQVPGYKWHELREIFIGLSYGTVKFRRLQAQLIIGEEASSDAEIVRKTTEFFLAFVRGRHRA
jgi:AcrR family transcriptional regulator